MNERLLPVGKLDSDALQRLIGSIPCTDSNVIIGPGIGRDVAVIDNGGENYLIVKTDPVTFATDAIGYYVVNVNANDIATCGGTPRWFLVTTLLPDNAATERMAGEIMQQVVDACATLGVTLVGGHTEITWKLDRPIVVGQMLGEVHKDRLLRAENLQVGDSIIVTKQAPLEGTALIAREMADNLREQHSFTDKQLETCANLLFEPGISVVADARVALAAGDVHCMHDPTEGGIATGLWELAEAGGVGLRINDSAMPLLPEGVRMCEVFGLDPLGLIASGSLLVGCASQDAQAIVQALDAAGIGGAIIGEAVPEEDGVQLMQNGVLRQVPRYDQDELTRLL